MQSGAIVGILLLAQLNDHLRRLARAHDDAPERDRVEAVGADALEVDLVDPGRAHLHADLFRQGDVDVFVLSRA